MKKLKIFNKANVAVRKAGLKLKKHSPEILVVGGVVGTVGATVLACKATTKASKILEESKKNINDIKTIMDSDVVNVKNGDEIINEYTEEDQKKDLSLVYVQTGLKLAKVYAPAVALGAMSITAILAGHNMTRKRYVATAAAYAVVENGFKDYRDRVIERFGKELDQELRYNLKTVEVEETTIDKKGKEKVTTKSMQVMDEEFKLENVSPHARFFDDGCLGWDKDPQVSLMVLTSVQNWANEKLQADKHLFLNDVYGALGIPKTELGQLVGWIYDEECPNGDNYVDFGIFETHNPKKRDFVNGYERVILLDFNVDGKISHLI